MSNETDRLTGVGLDHRGSAFPDTQWSVFLTEEGHDAASAVLDRRFTHLCSRYWYPLYAFLRKRGHSSHDAQDLTQGFLTKLLSGRPLGKVDPACGRFRSFLLGALNHYVSDQRKARNAAKRGGGHVPVPIDIDFAEGRLSEAASDNQTPEKVFDREWAVNVLREAKHQLEAEFVEQGKSEVFARLGEFLIESPPQGSYGPIARELGVTEPNLRAMVSRMRKRHAAILRDQVRATVRSVEDVDEEIRYLLSIFS